MRIAAHRPPASAAIGAIRAGDALALAHVLGEHPELATARLVRPDGHAMSLLHAATDCPGHVPDGAAIVAQLVAAGADVNARFEGPHRQTPLHWAASSNDVAVLDALLDAGADIEAPGAFGGAGGPLDNAVAFGQWAAAHRLVERGARTSLWHCAALGLSDRLQAAFAHGPAPSLDEITEAFWQACHGGQQAAARYLLTRGADLNWLGYGDATPLDIARAGSENPGAPTRNQARRSALLAWLESAGARSASDLR